MHFIIMATRYIKELASPGIAWLPCKSPCSLQNWAVIRATNIPDRSNPWQPCEHLLTAPSWYPGSLMQKRHHKILCDIHHWIPGRTSCQLCQYFVQPSKTPLAVLEPGKNISHLLICPWPSRRPSDARTGQGRSMIPASISVFECNLKRLYAVSGTRKNSGLIFYDAFLIHLHLKNEWDSYLLVW